MIFFYEILNVLTPKYFLTLYLYRITAVTIQGLSQSQSLLNSIAEQRASVALSFLSFQ